MRFEKKHTCLARWFCLGMCLVLLAVIPKTSSAQQSWRAWLTYSSVQPKKVFGEQGAVPAVLVSRSNSVLSFTARNEVLSGVRVMFGKSLRPQEGIPDQNAIVLGTVEALRRDFPFVAEEKGLGPEGFSLRTVTHNGKTFYLVIGEEDRGVLYGAYALLREMAQEHALGPLRMRQSPSAAIRWVNQWDNLDGSIERGYAGPSIFFVNGQVRDDLTRASEYARLLASVGINGCTVDNVNADLRILDSDFLKQIARIAAVFRPYGVRLSLSVDLSSPKVVGRLDTFDPLDPQVTKWWQEKVDEVYRLIPDFGGFVVKADSEGRPGPSMYKRSLADAANVLAKALKSHGGYVLYRGFVYNHHLDWTDLKGDRARAGYDNFLPYDGKFEDNVIIQIKHGPIDFQAREPVSPLIAGLKNSNEAIELQVAQEYTGQQRHLCFLIPMWKEVLDTDMHAHPGSPSKVADIVTGKTFSRPVGGFVAVTNVGMNPYWLGHPLAIANLYGFARLAWDPSLSSEKIVQEWSALTFGVDPKVTEVVSQLELNSWSIYESYTGPLGAGTLTDIINVHYGPGIESSERNGWGQWHRGDKQGIGMDRTMATGTGYTGQYPEPLRSVYESLAKCPDELLLFFHHVPYDHRLHSGKTVIQAVYDSHFSGAERAAQQVERWKILRGLVADDIYYEVLHRLEYQAGHAEVWRDAINSWFYTNSGIADAQGRVGNHPYRIEAEKMQLTGFTPVDVKPWETASDSKAVVCPEGRDECSASVSVSGKSGWYSIKAGYFDLPEGSAKYQLMRNDVMVDSWLAKENLPSGRLDGHTATRHQTDGVYLETGDTVQFKVFPDGKDRAPIDFLDLLPERP